MSDWYYVEGRERVGPVDQESILSLISEGSLNGESYLWRKGFDDWKRLNDIPELLELIEEEEEEEFVEEVAPEEVSEPVEEVSQEAADIDDIPPFIAEGIDWNNID